MQKNNHATAMQERLAEELQATERTHFPTYKQQAERMIEDGVLILPVKLGQKVYYRISETEFIPIEIVEIRVDKYFISFWGKNRTKKAASSIYMRECDIGNTVFLTKEDAKKAIKEERK